MIIGDLLDQTAIQAWAISNVVLALKILGNGIYTSSIRMRKNVFASPEDYVLTGTEPAGGADDEVERSRRMHQNDLETGLPFALAGLVYALTEPSTLGLWICFGGYPVARLLHSICYAKQLMPHRTVAFMLGFAITAWMCLSSLFTLIF